MHCKNCKDPLEQRAEKALSGEYQMVWASPRSDDWTCPEDNDNEHVPVEGEAPVLKPHVFAEAGASDPYCDICGLPEANTLKHPMVLRLDPDNVGESEYRAIYTVLSDAAYDWSFDFEEDTFDEFALGVLQNFVDHAMALADAIKTKVALGT